MQSDSNKFFKQTLSDNGKTVVVDVELVESARAKNFCVRIAGRDSIKLTKPMRASRKAALDFLHSISSWVIEKVAVAPESISLRNWLTENPRVYAEGREWKVWLTQSRTSAFCVEDSKRGEVVFSSPSADNSTDDELCEVFRQFASKKIETLVSEIATRVGIAYSSVSVRDQSGRWGSRSSSGKLSFNWRLILLPFELQQYVICHELAHVRFMDHSISFWLWLNSFCPRAKRLDRELTKISQSIFHIELK